MRRGLTVLLVVLAGLVPATLTAADGTPGAYVVTGVHTREQRSAVARTGAGIDEVRADAVVVRATPGERDAIARLGFRVEPAPAPRGPAQARDFPPGDSGYHNYAETVADLDAVALAHPDIVRRFSLGTSYEGRDLAAVRISDDAVDTGAEPAVLYVGLHHAREHLTTEVVLSLLHLFAESPDPAVRDLVRTRQIYIVPQLNPDGGEYDVATGTYAFWRKNRQPNTGSSAVGTDLNRNYSYRWGCCGGSSSNPASETYRGATPFSAPEADAMRRFAEGRPNLRTAISYHSYGDLILYPYGYTYTDIPADMSVLDHQTFVAMAGQMATGTGYTPEQGSDLYITDGDWGDWMYGARGVYAFTFELSGSGYGFYPPDELIAAEVAKNRDPAVYAATMADCPVRAAGGPCPGGPAVADFDGDHRTDVSVFRPSNGTWYVQGGLAAAFGTTGDIPVPGDYDGDDRTDVAVFRPSNGTWYVQSGLAAAFGTTGDIGVPGDYDGNGTDELAVFRPANGTWYVQGGAAAAFGTAGDVGVPGDYDGNGVDELAAFRPSNGTWYVQNGLAAAFGTAGDIPVPGDYDGNGTIDLAVFRPSNGIWYVQGGAAVAFGTSGDVPVPGDYDGDGRTDMAVFRPSSGTWFVVGAPTTNWGTSGDMALPVPSAIRQAFFP